MATQAAAFNATIPPSMLEAEHQHAPTQPAPAAFAAPAISTLKAPVESRKLIINSDLYAVRQRILAMNSEIDNLKAKRDAVIMEEAELETQLQQLDSWLSTCDALIVTSIHIEPHIKRSYVPNRPSITVPAASQNDIFEIMLRHPKKVWNSQELMEALPPEKREGTTRSLISVRMGNLKVAGKVKGSNGMYWLPTERPDLDADPVAESTPEPIIEAIPERQVVIVPPKVRTSLSAALERRSTRQLVVDQTERRKQNAQTTVGAALQRAIADVKPVTKKRRVN